MTDNTALAQELEGYIKAYDADYPALNEVYDVVCCVNENAEAILAALRTPAPAPVGGDVVERVARAIDPEAFSAETIQESDYPLARKRLSERQEKARNNARAALAAMQGGDVVLAERER